MSRGSPEDLASARRILCHGVTGSGKSTAARQLGEALGLPVHLVDEEVGWLPGWVQREVAEQQRLARQIADQECWIVDSTWSSFREIILSRAEVVVALDYPRWFSLQRLVRRSLRLMVHRTPLCDGNFETPGQFFSRDSIVRWHFSSFARKRAAMRAWEADPDGPRLVRVSSAQELDQLPRAIRTGSGSAEAGGWRSGGRETGEVLHPDGFFGLGRHHRQSCG